MNTTRGRVVGPKTKAVFFAVGLVVAIPLVFFIVNVVKDRFFPVTVDQLGQSIFEVVEEPEFQSFTDIGYQKRVLTFRVDLTDDAFDSPNKGKKIKGMDVIVRAPDELLSGLYREFSLGRRFRLIPQNCLSCISIQPEKNRIELLVSTVRMEQLFDFLP